jgi:NAD(P)-dependent dehydrogenase (short-subunit alcohol dehydrogenase family)
MTSKLAGRIALVTGASRGIGRAAALELAKAGAHIVAVARTQGGLEELDDEIRALGGSATLVPLDMKDMEGLDRLGGAIHERWGKLDIFLANAAILGPITPLGHAMPKEWDEVMTINVTANWRLVRVLDPLLKLSDAGRAVLVSSGAAHKCRPYWGLYSISKAAVEALARTWAGESETTSLKVMMVNPGPLRTSMRAQAVPGEDPMTLKTPEDLAPHIVRLLSPDWSETGKLFDFPTGRVLSPQMPA